MSHADVTARSGLRFVVRDSSARLPMPYFPQGIPAGFPSPADDYLQKKLDLHKQSK